MRLVFVTQQVDPASPVLGATVAKLRALAARVDELVVLADRAVDGRAARRTAACASSARRTEPGRGLRFEAALARELARRPRPAAVVAHMCPIYAVLAAPLARPTGVPVLLWFTHWRASRLLRLAERLSTTVITRRRRARSRSPRARSSRSATGSTSPGFACVERPGARPADARSRSAARHPPRASRRSSARSPRCPRSRSRVVGPSLTDEERHAPVALERARDRARRARPGRRSAAPSRATRCPAFSPRPTRSSTTCARARPTRSSSRPRRPACRCSPRTPRSTRSSRPSFASHARRPRGLARASASGRSRDARPRPRCGRRSCARGVERDTSVEGWADRVLEVAHAGPDERPASSTSARSPGSRARRTTCSCCFPALRERGCDVRFLLLHEDEPGAAEFARAPRASAGVPVERVRLARAADPVAFARLVADRPPPAARRSCTPTSCTPTSTGSPPAGSPRVPVLASTKHGFNAFRGERGRSPRADRAVGRLADPHIAISARPRPVPGRERGLRRGELRGRPLRHRAGARAAAADPGAPRLAVVGRLIPIKGHDILLAGGRRARATSRA